MLIKYALLFRVVDIVQFNMRDHDIHSGEVQIDPGYRGYSTNRLLSKLLPPLRDDLYLKILSKNNLPVYENIGGELEYLHLTPADLSGRTLDVGIGGGRSVLQALENGIDIYGIDLALKTHSGAFGVTQIREQIARDCLRSLISLHPDRVIEADAAKHIPFPDNSFDTVIACVSLPPYARNEKEAITSILEMIRVAKTKVVFSAGYSSLPSSGDIAKFGVGKNTFNFSLIDFLNTLKQFGVETSWKIVKVPKSDREHDKDKVSAHLNVSKKKQSLIKSAFQ